MSASLDSAGYRTHEFGDSLLIEKDWHAEHVAFGVGDTGVSGHAPRQCGHRAMDLRGPRFELNA